MTSGGGPERPQQPPGDDAGGGGADGVLDAYVDGVLVGPERRAFESRLAGDPALRAEVDEQRRIDGSLRAMFWVPAPPPLAVNGSSTGHSAPAETVRQRTDPDGATAAARAAGRALDAGKVWKLAVAFGLFVTAAVLLGREFLPLGGQRAPAPPRSVEEVYRQRVDAGFVPDEPVTGTEDAARRLQFIMARRVGIDRPPSGVQLLGFAHRCNLPPYTAVLLARVDGREVMVVASAAAAAPPAPAAEGTGNGGGGAGPHRYRRQAGSMVFDEISTFDRPRLLDLFDVPAPAAAEKR